MLKKANRTVKAHEKNDSFNTHLVRYKIITLF